MATNRGSKKTKRSYSLRNPRSVISPPLLDSTTGFYDRLEESDYPNTCPEREGARFGFSKHVEDANSKSLQIAEGPKEGWSKRKKRAMSLRVTKTESRVFLVENSIYDDLDADTTSQHVEPKAGEGPVPEQAAQVTCCLGTDDGQQLIECSQETTDENTEREKQKNNKMKNYKKTIDRALRRGWETFMSNLYTVTLSRSSAPPSEAPSSLVNAC